jgi:peptidoglycan/LPS O-acetylase OafA/YrhL
VADGIDAPSTEEATPTAEQATGVHLPRVPALDGLRGVAVIAVLFFHEGRLLGGYLGVDLFFVLSGFLITSLLLVEHRDHGRVRLGRFYERRARRLLPALCLALFGVAIYAAVWANPVDLPRIRWDGIATLFYFANWRDIVAKQSYWDVFRAPSPLQHTWSLSIEEQFYAFWPLIVIATVAWWRSARAVLTVAVGLGFACALFSVVGALHHVDQPLLYYSTLSRAPALLLGAALAAALVMRGPVASPRSRLALEVLAIVGAGYLAYEWSHQAGDGLALYRGPLLLCGIAAAVVIAAAAHPKRGPLARLLAFPPLVGAGLISYGLYLYHWPIYLILTRARTGISGWPLFGTRVVVSTAIAILSYALVEQPIRAGALRSSRALAALGTATIVVVGALVVSTRMSVPAIPAADTSSASAAARDWPRATTPVVPGADVRTFLPPGDWSRLTNSCETNRPLPTVQRVGRTRQTKIVVVGDSVGCFIGAAFDEHQVDNGIVTLNLSQLGCPLRRPDRERDSGGNPAPTYRACVDGAGPAIAAFQPDIAVLMVGGPMVNQYAIGTGTFVGPCDPSFAPWYEAGARNSIAALSATGATVVVVSIVHPPRFIDIGPGIAVPVSDDRDVDCLNRLLEEAVTSSPRAHLLDLDAYICPQGNCKTTLDGVTLRADGRHFQGTAANVVAAWMIPRVLAFGTTDATR